MLLGVFCSQDSELNVSVHRRTSISVGILSVVGNSIWTGHPQLFGADSGLRSSGRRCRPSSSHVAYGTSEPVHAVAGELALDTLGIAP